MVRNALLNIPRRGKQALALMADCTMGALAVALAVDLRLEALIPPGPMHLWLTLGCVLIALPIFSFMGLYRAIFR